MWATNVRYRFNTLIVSPAPGQISMIMVHWKFIVRIVNGYPAVYVISCVGEKNGKMKIVSSLFAIELKLCFISTVLNNKTIILLNLAAGISSDFSLLDLRPRRLGITAIFRAISPIISVFKGKCEVLIIAHLQDGKHSFPRLDQCFSWKANASNYWVDQLLLDFRLHVVVCISKLFSSTLFQLLD